MNSDSEAESLQKVFYQKFEPGESQPRGDENFRFLRKFGFLVKSREEQIWLTKSISRGFQTSKSPGVLALRAMFKISAHPRVPSDRLGAGGASAW